MPRGRRDIQKTIRIIDKIIAGVPFKQIAFEEKVTLPRVSFIKSRYLSSSNELRLNEKGVKLVNEEQLNLPLGVPNA
jgi:hypothetical protein